MNSLSDDAVWKALAHSDRRKILDALREGPLTTGAVTERLRAPRHRTLQHLRVLRDAQLVLTEARGRQRINYLNPVPIHLIYERWVSRYEGMWATALTGIKETVERSDESKEKQVG